MGDHTTVRWLGLIVVLSCLSAIPCNGQLVQRISHTNDISLLPDGFGKPITIFQATTVHYDVYAKSNTSSAVTWPPGSVATWEVFKTTDEWLMIVTNTAIVGDLVQFEASFNDTSLPAGTYRYVARVFVPDGNDVLVVVIGAGGFRVNLSPFGAVTASTATNGIHLTVNPVSTTNANIVAGPGISAVPIAGGYEISSLAVENSAIAEAPGLVKEVVTNLTGVSTVVATFAENIGQIAQVEITGISTTNFTYQIRTASGLSTNAWKIYWMSR